MPHNKTNKKKSDLACGCQNLVWPIDIQYPLMYLTQI